MFSSDKLIDRHVAAHEQTVSVPVITSRHRLGDGRLVLPTSIEMELYVRDELEERGLLVRPPYLSYEKGYIRCQLWSDRLGKRVEASREIAGALSGEYAVRERTEDPRNWRRSNMQITRSSMGTSVALPRSFAGRPIEAPKVHPVRERGVSVEGSIVSMAVRGSLRRVELDLDDYLTAGFDLDHPPQCVLKTYKSGRQTVMARPRPDANPTTLKSLLAQAPGYEVWLQDGDQHNLRRSNWDLRPRRAES